MGVGQGAYAVAAATLAGAILCCVGSQGRAADALEIPILYMEQEIERPPVLSNLVAWPGDEGEQGADLGIADNNTTGKFLKQVYALEKIVVPADGDILAVAKPHLAAGARLVVVNAPGTAVTALADLEEAADDLIFNAGSADVTLRDAACRRNVLHTLPSRAMLADGLMQFLAKRQWRSIFLIEGNRPGDSAFAATLRTSAKKFGLKIDHEKKWIDDADMRRNAAAEVPVFTQARSYDVVVVADEDRDFGQYLLYNTWLPRPVAGSAGIEPVAWHRVVEQWGAAQLQSRFTDQAGRPMNAIDYAAWAAVRSIGEAVTRTKSADPANIRTYILSEKFALAAFKGAKMSYRTWNGQLRQPIPLVHPQAVVALAPIEGFLHQRTELDTLGIDQPETACNAME